MAGCIRGPYIALYPNGTSKRAAAFIPLREDTRATLMLDAPQGRNHGFTVRTGDVTYELFAANANAQRRWVIGASTGAS